ncbi:MAG: 30S ribosome-binding factor RbfA [Thioalkalispiraceae bacterium]|jgi:ribosome-binding factor A
MPKDFERTRRVGEQLQRELAMLIQQEIMDPRVGMITVSAVEVSKDLAHAKVFITALNEDQAHQQTIDALQHAAGFLQHELGKRLKLRTIPRLKFVYDESIERGSNLSALIDSALAQDQKK